MLALEEARKLTKEGLGELTVLTGEDTGHFQLAKAALLEAIGFDPHDLTYSYFDMAETDYEAADLDMRSLPFFADEKVVILDGLVDVTTAKKRLLTDQELKQLEAYLEMPNDTTRLILLVPGKLDSKRRLVKLLKRDGCVLEASQPKEAELRTFFQKEIKELGVDMAPAVLERLLYKSNMDLAETSRNLVLLQAYKPHQSIEESDIDLAVPKTLQDNLFDLSQLLVAGRVDAARSLVRDLVLQGEDEVKLIAILTSQFRLYMQVQLLKRQGRAEAQIVSDLSGYLGRQMNPYQVRFALRDSSRLSLSFLTQVVKGLIEADYQIKTGFLDKADVLDTALLKIATAQKAD